MAMIGMPCIQSEIEWAPWVLQFDPARTDLAAVGPGGVEAVQKTVPRFEGARHRMEATLTVDGPGLEELTWPEGLAELQAYVEGQRVNGEQGRVDYTRHEPILRYLTGQGAPVHSRWSRTTYDVDPNTGQEVRPPRKQVAAAQGPLTKGPTGAGWRPWPWRCWRRRCSSRTGSAARHRGRPGARLGGGGRGAGGAVRHLRCAMMPCTPPMPLSPLLVQRPTPTG